MSIGVRKELMERICIVGATARIPGLVDRVATEVKARLDACYPETNVSVTCEEPAYDSEFPTCAFKGASAHLAASRVDSTVYLSDCNTITQDEYEDLGSAHIPSSFTG
jgi:actin-related protein